MADWLPVGESPYTFLTAKERDSESNLDYFGARYFSGAQGRWTTPDDIYNDIDTADPASWNRYAYVKNNPLIHVDPNGESATVVGGLGGGLTGGVFSIGSQLLRNGSVNWSLVGTATLRGAVAGAVAGSFIDTGGASAVVLIGGSAAGNIAGGAVERAITGEATTVGDIATDAAVGAGGAALGLGIGRVAEKVVEVLPVRVQHFTSQEGKDAISAAGNLRSGTYVTKPGEVAGKTASQIESKLDIQPGKGQHSITVTTTRGNLAVPPSGLKVPGGMYGGTGGASQRQLRRPVPIDPKKFKKTPEDPQ